MAAADIDSVEKISAPVPHLPGISHKKIWVDCDEEADALLCELQEAQPRRRLADRDVPDAKFKNVGLSSKTFAYLTSQALYPKSALLRAAERWKMLEVIECLYEEGVLRPLGDIKFKEGQKVKLRVEKPDLSKYYGIFGKASLEELEELDDEAQA